MNRKAGIKRLMRVNNERGIALVFTLLIVVVLIIFGSVFILRTINEWNTANREKRLAEAFFVAEGGAEAGLDMIDELINTHMLNTVNTTNPQVLGNKASLCVSAKDSLGFLVTYVKNLGTALLTLNGSVAQYSGTTTVLGLGHYRFDILITQKGDPVTVMTDVWDFPFYYQVDSTGTAGNVTRKVLLAGDFTVRVQRDNFAKFALFTDHHSMPSGTTVWFTNKTQFAGPIHTNTLYSFALNPGGTFDGPVTQHESKARFYNQGSAILADADANSPWDVPTFNDTYDRGEDTIVLSSSVQKQDLYDQARGGEVTTGNGIFIANDGTKLTGGIYVKGNSTVDMAVDTNDNAKYTITQGTTTKVITVDIPNNQTTVQTVGGSTSTYAGLPDGVDDVGTIVYVDGTVTSLKGAVQKDTEVTVSAETDIVITDDLVYSDYTPAVGTPGTAGYVPPDALNAANLLGLVAWGGDVRIGTSAPDDVNVHGIVMARNGVLQVDNYTDQTVGPRGQATLLGGAITFFYGAFGQFNGNTGQQISGYGRNFVYDSRTRLGKSPPYFPSMRTFIAFTNDITDKVAFQEGGF
jgi:hypothetical protein